MRYGSALATLILVPRPISGTEEAQLRLLFRDVVTRKVSADDLTRLFAKENASAGKTSQQPLALTGTVHWRGLLRYYQGGYKFFRIQLSKGQILLINSDPDKYEVRVAYQRHRRLDVFLGTTIPYEVFYSALVSTGRNAGIREQILKLVGASWERRLTGYERAESYVLFNL